MQTEYKKTQYKKYYIQRDNVFYDIERGNHTLKRRKK